jgi:esterase/lipase
MIQSKKDKATDYKTSKKIAAELKGLEKLVSLENSNHMILWDYDAKQVEDEIIKFITSEVE